MTVNEVLEQFNKLALEGRGDEQVFLDTNPLELHAIGEIGLDDNFEVIIWKE